ncbi:MAG TPA: lipid II flippase MurJ [Segeticoccus sp.]|uniref:lipid II flippase MurJ n=1 Tax=Segeticoccus sp. TaxID=2706531 RepID=UPI002D7EB68A|nr:lipid II flippase MurJ [Segeticoccus sp.]HET8601274.1 lipid II flippase MurJ [Segeticoccus sp.]
MTAVLTRPVASRVAGAAGLVAGATLLARIVGFGRWLAFSANVGTSCTGTAYTTANQLPNVLFELAAGGALAAVAVPLVRRELGGDRGRADQLASALLTWTVTLLVPTAAALALLARPVVSLLLPASPCPGAVGTATAMLLVFAPQVPLYGVGMVLSGVLHAHGRFLAAALAPLLSSVVVIGSYLGFGALAAAGRTPSGTAIAVLSGGTTAGVAALSLPLLVPVRRAGVRLRPTWRWPGGTVRRAVALAGAAVVVAAATQLATALLTRVVNAHGGPGSLPTFFYLQAVSLLPYAVLSLPLAVAAFPALAAVESQAADRLARSVRAVLVTGALGAALLVAVAPQAGAFFTGLDRGAATPGGRAALDAMPAALTCLAPGLLGLGLTALLTRALYVRGRARHTAAAMTLGWAVVALVPLVTLRGTADPRATLTTVGWSTTAGMTLAALLLLLAVRRGWGAAALRGVPRAGAAALTAAAVGAGVGRWAGGASAQALGAGQVWVVLAGLAGAAAVLGSFAGLVWLLDRDTAHLLARRGAPVTPLEPRDGSVPPPEPGDGSVPPQSLCGSGGQDDQNRTTMADNDRSWPGRVLLVAPASTGGIGAHVRDLADGLLAAGHQVLVAAPAQLAERLPLSARGNSRPGVQHLRITIGRRPGIGADRATLRALRRQLSRVDVVHAHGWRAGAVAALATRGAPPVPLVVTLHNPPPRSGLVADLLARLVMSRAGVVLAGTADLGALARRYAARRVEPAVLAAPALPPTDRATAARLRAELAPRGRLVLVVARLAPQKGLDVLLDAAALLPPHGLGRPHGASGQHEREVLVAVAGEGPLRRSLQRRIDREHLPVRLLGERPDMPALLAAADLVVCPSRWEGPSLALQEALHRGRAVVAADVGGIADLVGEAALLVTGGDAQELAHGIQVVLGDDAVRKALEAKALQRAGELPGQGDVVAATVAAYRRASGASPRAPVVSDVGDDVE